MGVPATGRQDAGEVALGEERDLVGAGFGERGVGVGDVGDADLAAARERGGGGEGRLREPHRHGEVGADGGAGRVARVRIEAGREVDRDDDRAAAVAGAVGPVDRRGGVGARRAAQAEAEARAMVAGAEQRAKQLAADAENAGKLAVEAAAAKAGEELAELSRQVDDKARAQAEAYAAELENKKAALRAKAGGKLDQAAALVVERIVNS